MSSQFSQAACAGVQNEENCERMRVEQFESLAIVGRGTYGEVRLVRKRDRSSDEVYGEYLVENMLAVDDLVIQP